MAVMWGWDVGAEAEGKPESDRNPCKVQSGLAHSKTCGRPRALSERYAY
jgi:hypothetical protein